MDALEQCGDFRERRYLSRFSNDVLGLAIHRGGLPGDADGDVTLSFVREGQSPVAVFSRAASHVGTGLYEVTLDSSESSVEGDYSLVWSYAIDGDDQSYTTYAMVGGSSPDYDALQPAYKQAVDSVWIRLSDLFDSPGGGPNLMTYFQSHFGRNRIAQLMRIALGRLNTMAQPAATYSLEDGTFPIAQWGPLLETQTFVEAIAHLRRSYVEQPNFMGSGAVTRLDRRDYFERWGMVLQEEREMLKSQMEVFKIQHMGFGRPKVLVSGGAYGRFGPTRLAGSAAARPRYWSRGY